MNFYARWAARARALLPKGVPKHPTGVTSTTTAAWPKHNVSVYEGFRNSDIAELLEAEDEDEDAAAAAAAASDEDAAGV